LEITHPFCTHSIRYDRGYRKLIFLGYAWIIIPTASGECEYEGVLRESTGTGTLTVTTVFFTPLVMSLVTKELARYNMCLEDWHMVRDVHGSTVNIYDEASNVPNGVIIVRVYGESAKKEVKQKQQEIMVVKNEVTGKLEESHLLSLLLIANRDTLQSPGSSFLKWEGGKVFPTLICWKI
jgi:hypothetical protein